MKTNSKVAVLVSSDHPLFLDGMRVMLGADPAIKLLGEARTLAETVSKVDQLQPDVLLLDIASGEYDAPAAIRRMKEADPQLSVVVLSLSGQISDSMKTCKEAGASAFIQPHTGMREVFGMIHGLEAGKRGPREIRRAHLCKLRTETRRIA